MGLWHMFKSTHHACSGGSRRAVTCRETRDSQCCPTANTCAGGSSRLVVMAALAVCLCCSGLPRSQAAGDLAAPIVPTAAESVVDQGNQGGGHEDPVTPLLLGIGIVLLAAKAGGDLMVRIKRPAVLGGLLVGVVLGNVVLLGFDGLEFLRPATGHGADASSGSLTAITLDMLARVGVILLLFEVGLDSNLGEMRRVGVSSMLAAVLGVVTPMGLGWAASRWLLPDQSWHVHLFIGATLCAPPGESRSNQNARNGKASGDYRDGVCSSALAAVCLQETEEQGNGGQRNDKSQQDRAEGVRNGRMELGEHQVKCVNAEVLGAVGLGESAGRTRCREIGRAHPRAVFSWRRPSQRTT